MIIVDKIISKAYNFSRIFNIVIILSDACLADAGAEQNLRENSLVIIWRRETIDSQTVAGAPSFRVVWQHSWTVLQETSESIKTISILGQF